jgi:hypothetical protein
VIALVLVVGCELEPPPKPEARGPKPEAPSACTEIAETFAAVLVATAADRNEQAALERERAQLVRQRAEECRAGNWSADVIACYRAAKARADLDACLKMTAKSG